MQTTRLSYDQETWGAPMVIGVPHPGWLNQYRRTPQEAWEWLLAEEDRYPHPLEEQRMERGEYPSFCQLFRYAPGGSQAVTATGEIWVKYNTVGWSPKAYAPKQDLQWV